MPMKGRFPIRRTLEYLQKGELVLKNRVKIMSVNYNTSGELSEGARSVFEHDLVRFSCLRLLASPCLVRSAPITLTLFCRFISAIAFVNNNTFM